MELSSTHLSSLCGQLSVPLQIHVCARVDGVLVGLLPKLKGEEGVLAPGDILVDVYLVLLARGQMGEAFAADGAEVHLGAGGQVDVPGIISF